MLAVQEVEQSDPRHVLYSNRLRAPGRQCDWWRVGRVGWDSYFHTAVAQQNKNKKSHVQQSNSSMIVTRCHRQAIIGAKTKKRSDYDDRHTPTSPVRPQEERVRSVSIIVGTCLNQMLARSRSVSSREGRGFGWSADGMRLPKTRCDRKAARPSSFQQGDQQDQKKPKQVHYKQYHSSTRLNRQ